MATYTTVPWGETPRMVFQVLRQVRVDELEDEGEGGLGVDDVVQRHDIGVLQLLQQARLPETRGDSNRDLVHLKR